MTPTLDHPAGTNGTSPLPVPSARPRFRGNPLVIPDPVALALSTALHGDLPERGRPTADGSPNLRNFAQLIGTLEARKRRDGTVMALRTATGLSYRFDLVMHAFDLSDDNLGVQRMVVPLDLDSAVCTRYQDVLQDGMRVLVMGDVRLDMQSDMRFAVDRHDLQGLRQWVLGLFVAHIEAVDESIEDGSRILITGTVGTPPQIVTRRYAPGYGQDGTYPVAQVRLDHTSRQRGSQSMRASYPVRKALPLEVMVDAGEELVEGSDALLRVGNQVAIEGRLSTRTSYRRYDENDATDRITATIAQRMQSIADDPKLTASERERRARNTTRGLLERTMLAVEVGYVELITGTPLPADERAALITNPPRRRARPARPAAPSIPAVASTSAAPAEAIQAMDGAAEALAAPELAPTSRAVRPRRVVAPTPAVTDGPTAQDGSDATAAPPTETA